MTLLRKQREVWRVQKDCGLRTNYDEPGLEDLKSRETPKTDYIPPFSSPQKSENKYSSKDKN